MNRKSSSDDGGGCLVYLAFAWFLLPFIGALRLKDANNPDEKLIGWIMVIVGCIPWLVVFITGAMN